MKAIPSLILAAMLLAELPVTAQTNVVVYSGGAVRRAATASARATLASAVTNTPGLVTTIRLQNEGAARRF